MGHLHDQLQRDLALKGFSQSTRRMYVAHVRRFVAHIPVRPEEVESETIRAYLHALLQEKGVSQSYLNQVYSALKFFYETTLCQDWSAFRIPRSKRAKRLPVVLSASELARLFEATSNLKHRTMLVTMYIRVGCGCARRRIFGSKISTAIGCRFGCIRARGPRIATRC